MTKAEILMNVAGIHNTVASVCVSGDNAILIGDSIRALRRLAEALRADVEAEDNESARAEENGGDGS